MRSICLVLILALILGSSLSATAAIKPRQVVCLGKVQVRQLDKKVIDQGVAQVKFHLVDKFLIKNIKVATKFKKVPAQTIEGYESRAMKRAIASGNYKADYFNIGHNGACQIGLGYQGDLAVSERAKTSWGVFMMGCGGAIVSGNLKCQMK